MSNRPEFFKNNSKINKKELREQLSYDANTGVFTWLKSNLIAGTKTRLGYTVIRIKKVAFFAHRLAWLYVYGRFPKNQIDHINGDPSDNRIINLRDVTPLENNLNRKMFREGAIVGCTFEPLKKKWKAKIRVKNKVYYLGYFKTKHEALSQLEKAKADFKNIKLPKKPKPNYVTLHHGLWRFKKVMNETEHSKYFKTMAEAEEYKDQFFKHRGENK